MLSKQSKSYLFIPRPNIKYTLRLIYRHGLHLCHPEESRKGGIGFLQATQEPCPTAAKKKDTSQKEKVKVKPQFLRPVKGRTYNLGETVY